MSSGLGFKDMFEVIGKTGTTTENVQNEEQNGTRIVCELPINMNPNQKSFERLGFCFEDIGDEVLYKATLPLGWKLCPEGCFWTTILDDKNRERAKYFYKNTEHERRGGMNLICRYQISCVRNNLSDSYSDVEVCVKDADKIIFNAGKCMSGNSDMIATFKGMAAKFLDANYPKWENPMSYWN